MVGSKVDDGIAKRVIERRVEENPEGAAEALIEQRELTGEVRKSRGSLRGKLGVTRREKKSLEAQVDDLTARNAVLGVRLGLLEMKTGVLKSVGKRLVTRCVTAKREENPDMSVDDALVQVLIEAGLDWKATGLEQSDLTALVPWCKSSCGGSVMGKLRAAALTSHTLATELRAVGVPTTIPAAVARAPGQEEDSEDGSSMTEHSRGTKTSGLTEEDEASSNESRVKRRKVRDEYEEVTVIKEKGSGDKE